MIMSFSVDHTKLVPGLYLSEKIGNISIWDIRMVAPSSKKKLTGPVVHTLEHLLAFYIRLHLGEKKVIGLYPMGCKTGFYLVTKRASKHQVLEAMKDVFHIFYTNAQGSWEDRNIIAIPGATEKSCGNPNYHNLPEALKEAAKYYDKLYMLYTVDMDYDNLV